MEADRGLGIGDSVGVGWGGVQGDGGRSGVVYDREFVVCSLDLLSGVTEGMGAGIESLVKKPPHPATRAAV